MQAVVIIHKIGYHDDYAALKVFGIELPDRLKEVGRTGWPQRAQEFFSRLKLMAPSAANERIEQTASERLECDGVQPDEPDVAHCRSQSSGSVKLRRFFCCVSGGHRRTDIEQESHRHSWFYLKHLQKETLEAKVSTPIHGAEVVAMMEQPVV
jgi:hypothetical protein